MWCERMERETSVSEGAREEEIQVEKRKAKEETPTTKGWGGDGGEGTTAH